jgi:hypothetical protein
MAFSRTGEINDRKPSLAAETLPVAVVACRRKRSLKIKGAEVMQWLLLRLQTCWGVKQTTVFLPTALQLTGRNAGLNVIFVICIIRRPTSGNMLASCLVQGPRVAPLACGTLK